MQRRQLLIGTLLIPALPAFAKTLSDSIQTDLGSSRLIYLTPLKSDGTESTCQGEVWYVYHNNAIYVNTQMEAWRANAIKKGLTGARIWVGDVGMWKRAEGAYKDLPRLHGTGSVVSDSAEWESVYPAFGEKYSDEWPTWGPRFKNGLEDGSRILLKYSDLSAES
ncbi:MAG: hypothetical protein OXC80_08065 [Gammaproteobacteria bacterium]|nr:hypothetical protein [Gammaproteobacteria bacterium]